MITEARRYHRFRSDRLRIIEVLFLLVGALGSLAWVRLSMAPLVCQEHQRQLNTCPVPPAGAEATIAENDVSSIHQENCISDLGLSTAGARLQQGWALDLLCGGMQHTKTTDLHQGVAGFRPAGVIHQALVTLATPFAVMQVTGHPFTLVAYVHLLVCALTIIPQTYKVIAGLPALKLPLFSLFRLQEVLLAMYGLGKRPDSAHLQPTAKFLMVGRWKVLAWMGWRDCMLQLPAWLELPLGILSWLLWEHTADAMGKLLGLPHISWSYRVLDFVLCAAIPVVISYSTDQWINKQFEKVDRRNRAAERVRLAAISRAGSHTQNSQITKQQQQQPEDEKGCSANAAAATAAHGVPGIGTSGANSIVTASKPSPAIADRAAATAVADSGSGSRAAAAAADRANTTNSGSLVLQAGCDACAAGINPLLAYRSPLTTRIVAIKVRDTKGLDYEQVAEHVRNSVYTALKGQPDASLSVANMVTVPGCVLLLGGLNLHVPRGASAGTAAAVDHLPAFADNAWNIQLGSKSSSGSDHCQPVLLSFSTVDQFEAAVADGSLQQSLLGTAEANTKAAAAAPTATVCCFAVAQHGGQLHLRLHSGSSGSGSSSVWGEDRSNVRVVLYQDSTVLMDEQHDVMADGSSTESAVVQIRLPESIVGSSTDAAVMTVSILEVHSKPADGTQGAAAASSSSSTTAAAAALAHVTALVLPKDVARELTGWVEREALRASQLAPLLTDVAAILDARQLLQEASQVRGKEATTSIQTLPNLLSSILLSADNLVGLSAQAEAAANRVLDLLHSSVLLPDTADFITIVRQQVLVASHRWRPLAAGALPSVAQQTAMQEGQDAEHKSSSTATVLDVNRAGGHSKPHSAPESQRLLNDVGTTAAEAAQLTPADIADTGAGGLRSWWLCWHIFSNPIIEAQYLLFRARYLARIDWVFKAYLVILLPSITIKYFQAIHWQLWPPYRLFGLYWVIEHFVQAVVMVAAPSFYAKHREWWLTGFDVRGAFYLAFETLTWPAEVLYAASGGPGRLIIFPIITQLTGLQRPKAAVQRWVILCLPTLWCAIYQARKSSDGLEAWLYQARVLKGWHLASVSLVFAAVHLIIGVLIATFTDVLSRRAFIRQQQERDQQHQHAD